MKQAILAICIACAISTPAALADEASSENISMGVFSATNTRIVLYESDGTEEKYFGPPRVSLPESTGTELQDQIRSTIPGVYAWTGEFAGMEGQSKFDWTKPEQMFTWKRKMEVGE